VVEIWLRHVRELRREPLRKIVDLCDTQSPRAAFDEIGEVYRISFQEIGAIVQYLRNSLPGKCPPLQLKEYNPTIWIDPQQIQRSTAGLELSTNKTDALDEEIG